MRAVLLSLVTTAIALGVLLVGCAGDEQQTEPEQQQAQTQQAQATQDKADASQRPTTRAQSSAAEAAQDEQSTSQDAEDAATTAFSDPLLAEAAAALEAWIADLETMVVDATIVFSLFGVDARMAATGVYQAEPLGILTTLDASALFGVFQELSDSEAEQAGESLTLQILLLGEDTYMSMTGLPGWVDLSDPVAAGFAVFGGLPGGDPATLADPAGLKQTLWCVETVGGDVSVAEHEGEEVWLVDCEIDVVGLTGAAMQSLQEQGIELFDAGVEVMRLRIAISRSSGAPLWIESEATLADPFAFNGTEDDNQQESASSYVTSLTTLRSWNEPVELPTPEPLIDASLLDGFLGEDAPSDSASDPGSDATFASGELLEADELLVLATEWANTVDELQMQFEAQAVIDGESRLASTVVRGSRVQGIFETEVEIDEASTFRLHWNRDGIWISAEEAEGEFVWEPSDPALLGFAGVTVDDFLANPDRINLAPYAELLDLSWLTRTVEGSGPAVYELVIESGPRLPGDDFFDQIVELLKAETAELLAESVIVESFDHYSTIITIYGDNGEVVSQVTTAEFQTNAGRVELVASLNLVADLPIEFSGPAD